MAQTVHIGLHERADNPQSLTGSHATALDMLSNSFNTNLKAYRESLKPGGQILQKAASVEKRVLVDGILHKPIYVRSKSGDFAEGPDTGEIEQALAQIAERQIATRAPALMPYWLGFQLLKKTDDNTRACGIFAFKVDKELIYIPVFCINGEIQGHELMYLVSQDRFVPSDEKQVNYLMSRKPIEPGKVELRDRSKIRQRAAIYPDAMYGGLKLSSLELENALRCLFKEAAYTNALSSPRFKQAAKGLNIADLFRLSAKATKTASQWCEEYPVFNRLLDYVLNGENIQDFQKEWEKRAALAKELGIVRVKKPTLQEGLTAAVKKEAAVPARAYVSVKTASEMPLEQFRFMSTEAVDRLHRRGYYVVDTRDQTKLAAVAESKGVKDIKNPHLPGFYNVLMPDGSFKKCVVLHYWQPPGTPESQNEVTHIVLDPGTGQYADAKGSDIIVADEQPEGDWFAAVAKGSLPKKREPRGDHGAIVASERKPMLVAPSGQGYASWLEETGEDTYTNYDSRVFTVSGQIGFKQVSARDNDVSRVVAAQPSSKLVYYDDELVLGNLLHWEDLLYKNTIPLKVQKRDRQTGRYSIDGMPEYDKSAALELLMTRHHLPEKTAEHILARADERAPVFVEFRRSKVAFSPSQETIGVNFPTKAKSTDWLTGIDEEYPLETSERVDALMNPDPLAGRDFWPGTVDVEDMDAPPPKPNARDIQLATQASESGQREFVSSQMLMSLLREVDDEGVISKYISVFEKACDALGRLYMQVLWRVDAFQERFGESQLKEFREMLLELFQRMGDFICYLRQRDVRPESRIALEHITDVGSDYGGQD